MSVERRAWTSSALRSPHQVPDKAGRIRRMFDGIARRYELVNSVFSFGRDRVWRRKAVQLAVVRPEDRVLDVACGTGDFARAFAAAGASAVVGCDFAHEMLLEATGRRAKKATRQGGEDATRRLGSAPDASDLHQLASVRSPSMFWCEADALRLPFRSESFTLVSCAFGVRNFADLSRGLAEMHRVLSRGGRAVILEFTRPHHRLARAVYEAYSHYFMPLAATVLSGDRTGAYRYLPRSVVSFLDANEMIEHLHRAGFEHASAVPLSKGVVTVYLAFRETGRNAIRATDQQA